MVSGEYESAFGKQIKNIADGTDLSDAVNLHQLQSASQQLKSELDKLSSKAETSSLADYMKLSSDQIQGLSSTVEIRDGSSIDFESGSEMNVDTGAQINMRSGSQLNFLNSLGFNTIVVRGMDECRQFLRAMREEVELRGV